MAALVEWWAWFGSAVASIIAVWSVVQNHIPVTLHLYLTNWAAKLNAYINPYLEITISEYGAKRFQRSELFLAVETYLSYACAPRRPCWLKVELDKDNKNIQISVEDHAEVTDHYSGATLWWYASKQQEQSNVNIISFYREEERRFYRLIFHKRHLDLVISSYLPFILSEGRAIIIKNCQRRLFTNNVRSSNPYVNKSAWSHVPFQHPATFDTLAMDPKQKTAIINDLTAFQEGKEYYSKVNKAWKRGYLLYGPPGTGKSTMIAAIANFLNYNVYDLELTAVKNNAELRKFFIETTEKSVITIENIDCSVLTEKSRKDNKSSGDKESNDDDKPTLAMDQEKDDATKVTLSGLLNVIDGLWSTCGGERIIIFTTNHKEKLEPALIRPGRMDKHIEMSYCHFEGFKVLAKTYLDVIEHELFGEIQQLLEETEMSPAAVVENMMPMSNEKRNPSMCLAGLIEALKQIKEEAAAAKAKEEEDAKETGAKKTKEKEEAEVKKDEEEDEGKDKTSEEANGGINQGDK